MLGKKKKTDENNAAEESEELQAPEAPEHISTKKTNVIDANLLSEEQGKLLEWLVNEFKSNYSGIFSAADLQQNVDPEATSLNMLFGIWSELRIMRSLKEKELQLKQNSDQKK